MKQRTGRNEMCPCGSGLKYKKCCINKTKPDQKITKDISISDILSVLTFGLENLNAFANSHEKISVKRINILNNQTLECQFYAKSDNSVDIKIEIGIIIGYFHGFFKDDSFKNINPNNYAVRAFDINDLELLNVISSKAAAAYAGNGNPIEWMKSSIFQENTKEYRLSIAKRQISEIENALRKVIVDRLYLKHGSDWFNVSVGKKLGENVKDLYFNQFGTKSENGNILIEYTFILQLKKIICTNWTDFKDLFDNKIEFEESIDKLNIIRREEAHNRDISEVDLDILKKLYEGLLIGITKKYQNIIPTYLIDNWKIQLKEIMSETNTSTYTDDQIQNEQNPQIKLLKTHTNLTEWIEHINDKILRVKSIVTPIQKLEIHNELISILEKYKSLYEELIECGKSGNIKSVEEKLKEIEKYKETMEKFANKYVIQEA